ncbi:MAG: hypothetical protein Fur0037_21390 [Planctomycetota bacterium]
MVRLLPPSAAIALLAACSSGPDVSVQDHGIAMPAIRLDYMSARDSAPRGTRDSGLGLEVTGGGGSFAGGDGEYDLMSAQGHLYLATPGTERFRTGALLGLEYLSIDVSQRNSPTPIDDGGSIGIFAGFDVGYECADRWEAYARATGTLLVPPSKSVRGELGLRFQPARSVEFFGAYRWWRLQRDDFDLLLTGADLDLHTDGPVLGMSLLF